MSASTASSETPRDIFRGPALSVGISSWGAPFAASDDCSQHQGGCAKNFRVFLTLDSGSAGSLPATNDGLNDFISEAFRQAAEKCRLAACAPQNYRAASELT